MGISRGGQAGGAGTQRAGSKGGRTLPQHQLRHPPPHTSNHHHRTHSHPTTHPTCTVLSMCSKSWCVTPQRRRSSGVVNEKPRRCQVALVRASSAAVGRLEGGRGHGKVGRRDVGSKQM